MDNPSFLFEAGREAVAQPARWTRGKVELHNEAYNLEARLWRSGGPEFLSSHTFDLNVEETFTPESLIGILQLMIDAGYGASTDHLTCSDETNLSDVQDKQVAEVLVLWVLGQDCRGNVPASVAERLRFELKRISMVERIGAVAGAAWSG